eukprot:jgi/Chrzof1/2898/Cz12g03070.t1
MCVLLAFMFAGSVTLTYLPTTTNYAITDTYSQFADLLSTHVDGIKRFSLRLCRSVACPVPSTELHSSALDLACA